VPERDIPLSQLFELVEKPKKGICVVKYCRKKRAVTSTLCAMHKMHAFRMRNPLLATYLRLRDGAKRRGLEFGLTREQFRELCEITGYLEGKGTSPLSMTLDRIDARRGYVPGNLQVMTLRDNVAKGNREREITFRDGIRIPWTEISVQAELFNAREVERRKSYVVYFRGEERTAPPLPDMQGRHWLDDDAGDDTGNEPF